ncbi:hypothetical protein Tco_0389315 [Tanacetum coccineum]
MKWMGEGERDVMQSQLALVRYHVGIQADDVPKSEAEAHLGNVHYRGVIPPPDQRTASGDLARFRESGFDVSGVPRSSSGTSETVSSGLVGTTTSMQAMRDAQSVLMLSYNTSLIRYRLVHETTTIDKIAVRCRPAIPFESVSEQLARVKSAGHGMSSVVATILEHTTTSHVQACYMDTKSSLTEDSIYDTLYFRRRNLCIRLLPRFVLESWGYIRGRVHKRLLMVRMSGTICGIIFSGMSSELPQGRDRCDYLAIVLILVFIGQSDSECPYDEEGV